MGDFVMGAFVTGDFVMGDFDPVPTLGVVLVSVYDEMIKSAVNQLTSIHCYSQAAAAISCSWCVATHKEATDH